MSRAGELVAFGRLTRPAQWPVLTAQLALGMVLATDPLPHLPRSLPLLAMAWLAWVVLLNGGTLAFNSAYDRDTGPVAYLTRPPQPPAWTARAAMAAMLAGAVSGLAVGPGFAVLILGCAGLSWLYSHPRARWKAVPGLDLTVNMVGYGAGTTLAGLLAGAAGAGEPATAVWQRGGGWLVTGFGLLFGALYPLTQFYQMADDRRRGDRTLATALGRRPSLLLALGLTAGACAAGQAALEAAGLAHRWPWPAAAAGAWTLLLIVWCARRDPDDRWQERAMYAALGLWALVDAALVVAWYG